jgi:hypothetical protein
VAVLELLDIALDLPNIAVVLEAKPCTRLTSSVLGLLAFVQMALVTWKLLR